ncbi:hypothetical protein CYMTET_41966 [Cymbomonas tetramitiformis]|uniref:Uncharacterized protein n=1 Tax=Cymbomonas tetramitiformis TaxID=36881 RepID=A0AAE0F245_9CHLO|nr:hypothetical protein CYMTET_41966 [Cymbomonas tetramitiformis]
MSHVSSSTKPKGYLRGPFNAETYLADTVRPQHCCMAMMRGRARAGARAVLNLGAVMDGLRATSERGQVDEWMFPTLISHKRAELETGTFHGEKLSMIGV